MQSNSALSDRRSGGRGIRQAAARALSGIVFPRRIPGPVRGRHPPSGGADGDLGGSPALQSGRSSYLSQSSAPPLDLSYLWTQEADRLAIYRDADRMDAESDMAAAALNAWATTAASGPGVSLPPDGAPTPLTTLEVGGACLTVRCTDAVTGAPCRAAQGIVDAVMDDCHLSERAWTIARDVRKYGDKFMEVVVDEGLRVRRLKSLPPAEMVREEDEYGRLQPVAFRQVRDGATVAEFAAWQIIHLRNNRQGDEKYGRSGLRTARRIWRMLSFLEDSLVSARLQRAYQKLIHFLPVSEGATTEERQKMVQDYIRQMTTSTVIDPRTGTIDSRPNPLNVATDFYMTISPSDSPRTGIQSLDPVNAQISQIADMEYFQNLLVAGLEVPKAYLGLERDVNSKATLGYQELHFLRQAGSLRSTVHSGFATVLDLALTLAGMDPSVIDLEIV